MLRDEPGLRPHVKPERALTDEVGTRDHQGVVARVAPYRYADAYELAAAENPLLVCLDQVTDPHNLGAVARSAEGAGATGVIVPSHGSARVTAAVARATAGAVEHLPIAVVQNLARYLNDVKGPDLWVWGRPPTAARRCDERTWTAGSCSSSAPKAEGLRPLVRRACDGIVSIPLGGQIESLNVSVAAAVLLYEVRRRRNA